MFKVSYTTKNKNGYVIESHKNFKILKDAYDFMRTLPNKMVIIGLPILEEKDETSK